MNLSPPKPANKTYQSPELRVYGDIRELTQAVGKMVLKLDSMFKLKTG